MLPVIFGVPALVLFMAMVMGVPFIYHLKRDRRYDATNGKPEAYRNNLWYGNV